MAYKMKNVAFNVMIYNVLLSIVKVVSTGHIPARITLTTIKHQGRTACEHCLMDQTTYISIIYISHQILSIIIIISVFV